MSAADSPRWVWEETNPTVSGSSGDISKLFRNEVVKAPGAFAVGTPSNAATLMAREVIQNSADAARELQVELGDDAPEFEIDFVFEALDGDQKHALVSDLDLGSLARRANDPDPEMRPKLGLSELDCLASLEDPQPLRVLKIVERGTTGMYGPFTGANSKMYLALISLGYTVKAAGSGGSYGYGKAGLIRGSGIRTVVAYTCFRPHPDEPGVTRRLLGMTYWGQHDFDGQSFTGFARFGDEDDESKVRPFEDLEADAIAERLGFEPRSADVEDDLGTTFLLLDPVVEPADLVTAIERNWWPAIEDNGLTATVIDHGEELVPRPRNNAVLRPFIEGYDLALSNPDNQVPEKRRTKLSPLELPDGGGRVELGALGLVAEPGGWSYAVDDPDVDEQVAHRSLVALVRGPRMVVEYLEAGRARPYVRGVFVADENVDQLLRQTEPKAHDAWQTRIDEGGVDPHAPEVARAIIDRVKSNVSAFRKSLKPPPRPAEDIRLPELEKLFRNLIDDKGIVAPPPPAGDRPFSIKVNQRLVEAPDDPMRIRLEGSVRFALFDNPDLPDEVEADLTLSYRFVEDGGNGEEATLIVDAPTELARRGELPYAFRGTVGHEYVDIAFTSESYPADWTGRLKADAEIVAAGEPDTDHSGGEDEQ